MNPLDLPDGLFLALYIVMAVFAYLIARAVTRRIGDSHPPARPLTVLELAYLASGRFGVRDAFLVGLLTGKAATLSPDGGTIHIDGSKIGRLPDFAPFAKIGLNGDLKWHESLDRCSRTIAVIGDEVERLGLCLDPGQGLRYRLTVPVIFALPFLLAIAKLPSVELTRGRPRRIPGHIAVGDCSDRPDSSDEPAPFSDARRRRGTRGSKRAARKGGAGPSGK